MPESQHIEYKKSFGKDTIISLVSFANTNGGKVIVGVDDKGKVCGVEIGPEAIVHRDYKNASDIVIKIFDDRIIFTNPGKIFGNQTIQDLERNDYVSSLRNKLLAEAFYLTGDIEKYGTGFIRIRESLEGYPDIKFAFSEQGDFFKAELRYTPKKTPKKISPVVLTELEQTILSAIKNDNTITLIRLAGKLNLSKYTVAEYTDKLKKKHVLQRIGSKRSGYWHVTETSGGAKSNED